MELLDLIHKRVIGQSRTLGIVPKPVEALDDAGDDMSDTMADYTDQDLTLKAVGALHAWIETEDGDLDAGETMADRLLALFIGIADADQDGELDDDESAVLEGSMEAAWSYLASKGVADEDIDALLNEGDNDAAGRVSDLLKSTVGDGEAAMDDMENATFGMNSGDAMDSAVYKKRLVVRGGKKVRINKRISGTVRLTSKQKMAIKKAGRKSHSAGAMMRRAKSVKVRARVIAK